MSGSGSPHHQVKKWVKTYSVGPVFLMLNEVHELNYSQYYMSLPETYTIVKQDNSLYGTTICRQPLQYVDKFLLT